MTTTATGLLFWENLKLKGAALVLDAARAYEAKTGQPATVAFVCPADAAAEVAGIDVRGVLRVKPGHVQIGREEGTC